jgi:hypothetical protein
MFYEGTLQNGVSDLERLYPGVDLGWPNLSRPMYFLISNGNEEMASSGTSFLNRTEASSVEKIVTMYLKCGITPDQIGVITPYEGQRAYVVSHMQRSGPLRSDLYKDIEVASVDSFQVWYTYFTHSLRTQNSLRTHSELSRIYHSSYYYHLNYILLRTENFVSHTYHTSNLSPYKPINLIILLPFPHSLPRAVRRTSSSSPACAPTLSRGSAFSATPAA